MKVHFAPMREYPGPNYDLSLANRLLERGERVVLGTDAGGFEVPLGCCVIYWRRDAIGLRSPEGCVAEWIVEKQRFQTTSNRAAFTCSKVCSVSAKIGATPVNSAKRRRATST